ncbi:MAG: hypothetical protein ACLQUZ_13490 [Rhizomicrobium sp.]
MQEATKPHWAWPHVVGVLVALIAYFVIFRFTGDSDLFIAIAMGAGGMVATWGYIRFLTFSRGK